ncbi:translocation/assembly module TamB domain-containing protein [Neogemmobacter tilapiae]|uniref:Translocation/assembly module TamB n=1 Tax=Neogemmobacter tilapiae TaxID=875041 RepID=A0A918TIA2_9RHOB|nr:translocation/assembly module TamB domain-containing protein [Gemmobacter tilapiae]GHC50415.1 translocation/assembly module TamB [Gemmobacter tilapiae]
MKRILFPLLFLALPAQAQESDRDFLTGLLEDNLSGAGRQVIVTGFQGALSSQATIERLTIADDQGIWLTLNGVVLDWNRSALLGGRVSVNQLTADEIILDRLPKTETTASPEAGGFAIPELPVSVELGQLGTQRLLLGESVLGEPIEASITARAAIDGGQGAAQLTLERTDDGPAAKIEFGGSFDNASQQLVLRLSASEAAGGIATRLLNLPGNPAVDLSISGDGPISDFTADVRLASAGQDRLTGQIELIERPDGQAFRANLAGDLAPLFLPEYADFFGNDLRLTADGLRRSSGALSLNDFDLSARSIQLSGQLQLRADGLPDSFNLTADIADPAGQAVTLPIAGETPVQITKAHLQLGYDSRSDTGWRLDGALQGLSTSGFRAQDLALSGAGRIGRSTAGAVVGGSLRFNGQGLATDDPTLQPVLAQGLSGQALFHWQEGQPLALSNLTLQGPDFGLQGNLRLSDPAQGLRLSGKATINADDLTRFALLAGRPLTGAVQGQVSGQGLLLAGAGDVTGQIDTTNVTIGQPHADRLLQGQAQLAFAVTRDATGITLKQLDVTARQLTARAQGQLSSTATDLTAQIALTDLAALDPAYGGALSADLALKGPLDNLTATLKGNGTSLRLGIAEADRLLAGTSTLDIELGLAGDRIDLRRALVQNPQLNASAQTQGEAIALNARLANLALLLPDFPGPVTLTGTARPQGTAYALDLTGTGPGGINARVTGTYGSTAALRLSGTAQAGLANVFIRPRTITGPVSFDLALNGPPQLSSLSGTITLSRARLADSALPFSLAGIEATARLAAGRADVTFSTAVSSGGQITGGGSLSLSPPFTGDLQASLAQVILRDPRLYQTRLNGDVRISGPLTGGALVTGNILLNETEIRVPDTGLGAAGSLPDLQHVAEPADVRETRRRAGLLGGPDTSSTATRPFALDITIDAPERVFVRGRGLDAELGGSLRLTGTSDNIQPIGQFDLIRGRLDILGKRLEIAQASLQMEGNFDPRLDILASTESEGITASVRVAGRAFEPEVTFESSPDLPEEEILSRLLFARDLTSLSAFQLAQLASAVATLAGRGGEGIVAKLRKGFGLDDLDVSTAEDGNTAVKLGKYISRNAYTTIEVESDGTSEIQLNLDITDSITARGSVDNKGDTGIGLFFEKDY